MSNDYDIWGEVHADGSWTRFSTKRTTDDDGSISFDPGELAGHPFSMRLRSTRSGDVFSDTVVWNGGHDTGRKTLATDVIGGTEFTIDARGGQGKTSFNGKLRTE